MQPSTANHQLLPTILVTGGTGYIGAHTVVELLSKGYSVVIADNLSNSHKGVVDAIAKITGKNVIFEQVELCNSTEIETLFNKYPIKAIIHFAAHKAVGESVHNPLKYYKNNLLSLVNLLEATTVRGIEHFVFSSSCSVYANPDLLPVTEQAPFKEALSPYANTKQIGEEILKNTVKATLLKVIALRYFNPVGAHESSLIGELPVNAPTNLVPVITQTAIGKRVRMEVFGNDYNTPDGSCIRDYIHVVDVAKAHVKALSHLEQYKNTHSYEVFNLGTGKGTSVVELIDAFEDSTGVKVNYQISPRRDGDVESVYADTTLANNLLEWKAELGIPEMIQSAWSWEQALAKTTAV